MKKTNYWQCERLPSEDDEVHAVLKFKKPCYNCVKNVKGWGKKMEGFIVVSEDQLQVVVKGTFDYEEFEKYVSDKMKKQEHQNIASITKEGQEDDDQASEADSSDHEHE
ncbi:hypothetical protein ACFX12_011935 [Malus domestica]